MKKNLSYIILTLLTINILSCEPINEGIKEVENEVNELDTIFDKSVYKIKKLDTLVKGSKYKLQKLDTLVDKGFDKAEKLEKKVSKKLNAVDSAFIRLENLFE